MSSLTDLEHRLSKAMEFGRGIYLSADDVCLLLHSGAYEAVMNAMIAEHKAAAVDRLRLKEEGQL